MARRRGRRRPPRPRTIVLVVVGVWLVVAGAWMVSGALAARDGKHAADAARAATSPEDLVTAKPLADLRRAQARFAVAHHRFRMPLLAPLRVLPVVGRQLQSADALSNTAARVASVGARAVAEAQRVLNAPHRTGPDRVVLLRRLADVAAGARRELDGLSLGPDRALVAPLAHAHDLLRTQLGRVRDGLAKGSAGARAAADLLAGPRRYLVLAANNSEMRDGAGMFLSAGLLETANGTLHLDPFVSAEDLALPAGAVPPPPELAEHWSFMHPTEEWRNLGTTPRFDVTAPLAARMWAARGNPPIDGVLSLDPLAVQAVLRAVGPVQAGDQSVSADDVADYLLHGQYVRHARDDRASRKEELGTIAEEAVRALQEREWSVGQLGKSLAAAARGRHLLAWSTHAEEQDAWRAAGVDGALSSDSLALGVISLAGNKLDHFVDVAADVLPRRVGRSTAVVMTIRVRNVVPSGEPAYVSGRNLRTGLADEEYSGILSLNLPGAAEFMRVDGFDRLVALGDDGPTKLIAVPVRLKQGEERTFVARFQLPGNDGELHVLPSARVPTVAWTSGPAHWDDQQVHALRW